MQRLSSKLGAIADNEQEEIADGHTTVGCRTYLPALVTAGVHSGLTLGMCSCDLPEVRR